MDTGLISSLGLLFDFFVHLLQHQGERFWRQGSLLEVESILWNTVEYAVWENNAYGPATQNSCEVGILSNLTVSNVVIPKETGQTFWN